MGRNDESVSQLFSDCSRILHSEFAISSLKVGGFLQSSSSPGDPVRGQLNQLFQTDVRCSEFLLAERGVAEEGRGPFLSFKTDRYTGIERRRQERFPARTRCRDPSG